MHKLTLKAFARESTSTVKTGKRWYLPYGFYHPQIPGKILVVFDLSVELHGISFNKNLIVTNDLICQNLI